MGLGCGNIHMLRYASPVIISIVWFDFYPRQTRGMERNTNVCVTNEASVLELSLGYSRAILEWRLGTMYDYGV